jgi:hypothetical protein
VCGFVERQLQPAHVAPVDAFRLRGSAIMRDRSLTGRTFPRHRCTGYRVPQLWCRRSSAEFADRWHELCEGPAMTVQPPPLPPCPRCHRLTGVAADENTRSSPRWFICRFCGPCACGPSRSRRRRTGIANSPAHHRMPELAQAATVFIHPKISSMRFRRRWLTSYPACRGRPSIQRRTPSLAGDVRCGSGYRKVSTNPRVS